jgi:hypothetical protein
MGKNNSGLELDRKVKPSRFAARFESGDRPGRRKSEGLKKKSRKVFAGSRKALNFAIPNRKSGPAERSPPLEEDGSLNYESTNSPGFRQGRPNHAAKRGGKKKSYNGEFDPGSG